MILVLASAVDRVASEFVHRAGSTARLLTCRSLSSPGWRLTVPVRESLVAVVDGSRIPAADITAVVTRLPYVGESELPQIAAADRAYVASEMQAFLHAFLSALPCPVVNRPMPVCLAGPNWRRAQWLKAARANGFNTSAASLSRPPWPVSVIGGACFGISDPSLQQAACRLAEAAGAQMLRLWCAGEPSAPVVVSADLWPDLTDPAVAAALLDLVSAEVPA
ncbi:MAG TPA: hypothetical protein VKT49_00685 [Bryobacteraceae bacterium]|nr:hypothetical protein [Bryobacteraceae bacterium]